MRVTPHHLSTQAGVYRIVNTANGKSYVGSAVNFHRRAITHKHSLSKGVSQSRKLQAAWSKYGEEAFRFEVLLVCEKRHAVMYEQICIDALGAANTGYNILPTAGSMFGFKHSPETVFKMIERLRGGKLTEAHKSKISDFHRGRKHSEEHIKKVAEANRGQRRTVEQIEKFSKAHRGQPVSEETRELLRSQRIGVRRPEVGPSISAAKRAKAGTSKTDKLNPELVREIKNRLANGGGVNALSREFGVSQPCISAIKSGARWGHIK